MSESVRTLVFATNNEHKLDEIRKIMGSRINILSLRDINCNDDIPENEPTLECNALAKARYVHQKYGYDCFADDTGLEVEALGGAPGVHTARYAPGSDHDNTANMRYLLQNLKDESNRNAAFRTVIALILDGEETLFTGKVTGVIAREGAGTNGFGYDPVFIPENSGRTFAQMSDDEKNAISHRGRAVRQLINRINEI